MLSRETACPLPAANLSLPSRIFPKLPGYCGMFVPMLVGLSLLAFAGPVFAQTPPDQHPPTAAAPAVPGAQAPKATETAPAAAAQDKPNAMPAAVSPNANSDEAAHSAPKSVAGTGSSLIPHDLSPVGMFMNADIIVKVVMVGLAFASLATWTILLVKLLELVGAQSRAKQALDELASAESLDAAVTHLEAAKAPVARMAQAALAETQRSAGLPIEGIKERAAALLSRIEARSGRAMQRGTGVLATIGSTAPFVGLFGTVWGIMNSFIGISKTNTTNLAVVAPGIAEALLATAFGLVAAIPAVIIYNMFARGITGYRALLGDAATEILRLLSRDLDRAQGTGRTPLGRQAAE